MKLWEKRVRFTRAVFTELLPVMYKAGMLPALDWGKRCLDCKVGSLGAASFHCMGLAVDINLYTADGDYQGDEYGEAEAHNEFGAFWKSLGPEYTWGGDFPNHDNNHYSYGEGKQR